MTDDKPTINTDDKPTINVADMIYGTEAQKTAIINYLTDHITGKSSDFCRLLSLRSTRVKELLSQLITDGVIVAEGANKNRMYRLREKI